MSRGNRRRRRFRLLLVLVGLSVVVELTAYAAGRALQLKWGMYVDPVRRSGDELARDYGRYLEICDRDRDLIGLRLGRFQAPR